MCEGRGIAVRRVVCLNLLLGSSSRSNALLEILSGDHLRCSCRRVDSWQASIRISSLKCDHRSKGLSVAYVRVCNFSGHPVILVLRHTNGMYAKTSCPR